MITKEPSLGRKWVATAASVPGRKHIRSGTPCQDASVAGVLPRPYLAVCDGRGSSPISHHGSQAAVSEISNFVFSSEPIMKELLDRKNWMPNETMASMISECLHRSVSKVQERLAQAMGAKAEDFEFTLVLAIVGTEYCLVVHIGDGALVAERDGVAVIESAPTNGEFANATEFVCFGRPPAKLFARLVPSNNLGALAAFTDGTAAKMIEAKTMSPAPGFSTIWKNMREMSFSEKDLLKFLTESFWEPAVQDDRSLAALAMLPPSHNVHATNPAKDGEGSLVASAPSSLTADQNSLPHAGDISSVEIGAGRGKFLLRARFMKLVRKYFSNSVLLLTVIFLFIAALASFSLGICALSTRISQLSDELARLESVVNSTMVSGTSGKMNEIGEVGSEK